MHKTMMAAMAAVSLLALAGCRQTTSGGNGAGNENVTTAAVVAGSIDGTWKADIDSVQFDQKPDDYLLQGGQYSCKSCVPAPFTVAADGAFHPVSLPYADSYAVKVVDDHNIVRTQKKGGRQVGETKVTISTDGNTLTGSFNDTSVPNAPPSKGEFTETRVGPAPAGAHAVSGQWKTAKLANFNAEQLTTTFKLDDDTLHLSSPSGYSYDAKLDGTDVPIKGDIANTTASVKKLDDGSYQETDKRDGKVVSVTTFVPSGDGKLHVVSEDKLAGSTVKYDMTKQ